MPAPPRQCNDGNPNTLLITGVEYDFPFSSKGDNDSFEVTYRYTQDRLAFQRLAPMSTLNTPLGLAYFVEQGKPRDLGQRRIEFDRTFASVPRKRSEGASVTFEQQWWRNVAGDQPEGKYFYTVSVDIEEQTFTVDGVIVYEYFTYRPEPLIHPRAYLVFGILHLIGNAPQNGLIVAQDSTVEIYKGGIYVRITPYAKLK